MNDDPNKANWGILGHENIVQFLQSSIKNEKVSHAYLFSGQPGLGKTITADKFVQNLICEKGNSCDNCSACTQLMNNVHPDVMYVQRSEDKKNISIEEIRNLQTRLSQKSFLNSYKVAVINNAHELSESASNSLLKTLEEPGSKTVIILITSQKDLLPETIASRCQVLNFLPVSKNTIYKYLENINVARGKANIYANLSNGRPGVMFEYMNDQDAFEVFQKQINGLLGLMEKGISQRFILSNKLINGKDSFNKKVSSVDKIINQYLLIIRDLILIKAGQEEAIINYFAKDKLVQLANKKNNDSLLINYTNLNEVKMYLNSNINPSLALENVLINI